jgi:capsular exopolysaccharide synthesis family protein
MTPPIVKRYFLAVDRYKWVIPVGVAVGMAAAGVVVSQPEPSPTYQAEATLVSNRPPISFSAIGTEVRQPVESLTSDMLLPREVIEAVAKEVGIDPRELVSKTKVDINIPKAVRGQTAGAAEVAVSFKDGEPKRAGEVVSQYTRRMVEQSRLNNSARLRSVIDSINQRLPKVRQELQLAEQSLEQYDRVEGPQLLAAQNGSLIGAITGSETQQRQLQLQLEGVNAQIASIEQRLGLDPNQAYASSALSADPIIGSLRAQIQQIESQLAVLSKDLRPEHPTIVTLKKQQQAYEEELSKRAQEVMGGNGVAAPLTANVRQNSSLDPARQQLANTLVALKTQQESLQQQLIGTVRSEQELRQQYAIIPNKQLARTRLEDQVKLKKALHDQMQAKLVDARAAEAETVSSLSLSQAPTIKQSEVKAPKSIPVTLAIGGLVGLLVGGGLIFLLDTLEGKFYTEEDLREALRQRDVTILGSLPLVKVWHIDDSPVLLKADSPYVEYYERFRSKLRLAEGKALRMVLISSTIDQEGKTVCAYNLAIASARAGKRTLLIEADLRSPSRSDYVGIAPDPDSLIEPLRYYGQISECIRLAPEVENLYIVPSAGPQRQAASILESSEMRRLLEDSRGRFDLVVLDSPSLSRCNDALLLEPYSDGMVIVTRPGTTQESILTEAIDHLTESDDHRLLGAVINAIDIQLPRAVEDAMIAGSYDSSSNNGTGVDEEVKEVTTSNRN